LIYISPGHTIQRKHCVAGLNYWCLLGQTKRF
jgi:hypothetical protein